jgi:hypothetical protein
LTRRALVLDRQLYGERIPGWRTIWANLGSTEATLVRHAEAEALYREAAGILRRGTAPITGHAHRLLFS